MKELTDQRDPLSCLAALSMLKEHLESISSQILKSNLATFFLAQLESLLPVADSSIKPLLMQVSMVASKQHQALRPCSTASIIQGSKGGVIYARGKHVYAQSSLAVRGTIYVCSGIAVPAIIAFTASVVSAGGSLHHCVLSTATHFSSAADYVTKVSWQPMMVLQSCMYAWTYNSLNI